MPPLVRDLVLPAGLLDGLDSIAGLLASGPLLGLRRTFELSFWFRVPERCEGDLSLGFFVLASIVFWSLSISFRFPSLAGAGGSWLGLATTFSPLFL